MILKRIREMIPPYMLTAMALKRNVDVQSQLSCTLFQSDDNVSRAGRKVKYAAIKIKTKANDVSVALSSCGSTLIAALIIRVIRFLATARSYHRSDPYCTISLTTASNSSAGRRTL